uniref:Uncharacterized protein n=1 Tax=viral metagenome TaxID=1070528 RepID=A0A6C0J715_9ZZZZ
MLLHSKDIATDWMKFGTMFIMAQWLSGGSLMDRSWMLSSLFTLIGFAVYHLTVRNFIKPELTGKKQAIANDWLKVGTMLIVARLLSGGSLIDSGWFRSSMAVLVGFTVYNIIVSDHIQGNKLTYDNKLKSVIDDWAKVGTMLAVSRVLSCEDMLDPKWIITAFGTLFGFTVYDLGTSHLIDLLF